MDITGSHTVHAESGGLRALLRPRLASPRSPWLPASRSHRRRSLRIGDEGAGPRGEGRVHRQIMFEALETGRKRDSACESRLGSSAWSSAVRHPDVLQRADVIQIVA